MTHISQISAAAIVCAACTLPVVLRIGFPYTLERYWRELEDFQYHLSDADASPELGKKLPASKINNKYLIK
jgi:hypothetical protein